METPMEQCGFPYRIGLLLLLLLLALVFYGFAVWAWRSPAELGAYDMLMRMRPAVPRSGDIVVLAVDRKTVDRLGKPPWSRTVHARIIRLLHKMGAKAIVYDLPFAERDAAHPGADSALARALTRAGNVFLPMVYDPFRRTKFTPADIRELILMERYVLVDRISYSEGDPVYRYYLFVTPLAEFVSAARGVGGAVGVTDASGVVREAQVAYLTEIKYPVPTQSLPRATPLPRFTGRTAVLQGLPLVAARGILGVDKERTQVDFGEAVALLADLEPFARIPIDTSGRMLINYAGPSPAPPYLSAADLLGGKLDSGLFAGKVVVVGATCPGLPASAPLATPYSLVPRAEVTANAIGTILDGRYIARDRLEALATLLVLAVILGLLLPSFSRWDLGCAAVLVPPMYVAVAALVLAVFRHALPVIPSVLLILSGTIAAVLLRPEMFVRVQTAACAGERA